MNQIVAARNRPEDDLISLILQVTAIAQNSDTLFMHLNNESPVRAYQRPTEIVNTLGLLLSKLVGRSDLQQKLFLAMLDQGNFLDIAGELQRQMTQGLNGNGYKIWQGIATAIASVYNSQVFHFKRIYIMQQPFKVIGGETRDEAIQSTKSLTGIPLNSNWDAISYKIPPRGSAYFCIQYSDMIEKLQQSDIAIIDQLQERLIEAFKTRFREVREQEESKEDDEVSDYSIFMESRVAAVYDEMKKQKIQSTGDLKLIQYIIASVQAFVQGIIPGGIAPGKITACQDVVSMTELQAAIQSIASQQIAQAAELMPNPAVRRGIKYGAEHSNLINGWTVQQAGSINQAASITQQLVGNFRDPIDPQQKLEQQIAGGANTLTDQLNMQWQDTVVRLTPLDKEILRQSLSVLIASIRVRFDATQNTKTELVSQEDVDHLMMCERLAQYVEPNAQLFITQTCTTLIMAMTEGHNKLKLANYGPKAEVIRDAVGYAMGLAETTLKAIPIFDADIQEGRNYFNALFSNILLSMCDIDRIERQRRERYVRRLALFGAVKAYQ